MPVPQEVASQTPGEGLPEGLQGVIINDCSDPNAEARQRVRFHSLFGVEPTFIGLGGDEPDLEAAGQLVDVLDAARTPSGYPDVPTVVLVNVAPRGDDVKEKWENGTPFSHTTVNNATVFVPYEGRVLPLLHKLGLAEEAELLDIPETTGLLADEGRLTEEEAEKIQNTQFRSLEFLPLAAHEIMAGRRLPSETMDLEAHPAVEGRAWFVDNFGNVKTTLLPEDIGFEEGDTIELENGQEVTCYRRLTDVPTGEFALTVGSSGYGESRWLEVVQQRGPAATELGLRVGSPILAREAETVA